MFDNIVSAENINYFLVFLEGLLSFFSPCILPLLPVYLGYLAGNTKEKLEDGTYRYKQSTVFLHTLCFVLGISFAFFILGMAFSALGSFFQEYKLWFSRVGGVLIIFLALIQLGFLRFSFLSREKKLPFRWNLERMNPFVALIMGFTFSFAWTPCVGPALSSVLILASSAENALIGNLLVLVYTAGFIIPFLLLGLFTSKALNFVKKNQKIMKYTIKAGGILLLFIGIMMISGWMEGLSGYFSTASPTPAPTAQQTEPPKQTEKPELPAFDFTLTDQKGQSHTLSDYKGKVVFLNFWATWCGPCQMEMPHIEELYQEYGSNSGEVIFLGVAQPNIGRETDISGITAFLAENSYTFPTVFDENGEVFADYYINSFPTTFMIDRQGNVMGYVPGMMTKEMMQNIIQQTLEQK